MLDNFVSLQFLRNPQSLEVFDFREERSTLNGNGLILEYRFELTYRISEITINVIKILICKSCKSCKSSRILFLLSKVRHIDVKGLMPC